MNWIVVRWITIKEAVAVRRERRAIDSVAAAAVARRADCDYKFNGCDDPRCKIGHCILEIEKRAARAVAADIEVDPRIKERAWYIARVILDRDYAVAGGPPEEQVFELAKSADVQSQAKDEIAAEDQRGGELR